MAANLGNRFWRLLSATGISSLGDGMVLVALPLLALTATQSPLLISGVLVAVKLPGLLVALPAGAFIDRVNRRRLMVRLQVVRFVAAAAFAIAVAAGVHSLPAIYIAAFVLGSLTVVFDCGATAALPAIVPANQLVPANARLETVYETAQELIGRGIGGLVFTVAKFLPFLGEAIGYLASGLLLPAAIPDTEPTKNGTSFLADLRDGLRWFGHNRLIRLLSAIVAQLAFCQAVVLGILVLYATQDLHLSKAGYGLMLGVSAIGNLLGAAIANRLHSRVGAGWSIILAGAVAALTYPILAATHSAVQAGAALTIEAAAITVGIVASLSLRQSVVPQEMQGRVASAHMTVVMAAFPLGSLAGGLLGGAIGIRPTFLLAGCLQFVVVAITSPALLAQVRRRQPLGISNL
jgi:MFS family permease